MGRHVAGRDLEHGRQRQPRSRMMNMPQPMVVANHLCASMVAESARSNPLSTPRSRRRQSSRRPRRHRRGTRARVLREFRRTQAADRSCPRWWCPPRRRSGPVCSRSPRSAAIADSSAAARHAAGAVGRHQPHRRAPDPRLMRDLEPAAVAFLRGVEDRSARKGARAVGGELRMGARSTHTAARCSWPLIRRGEVSA